MQIHQLRVKILAATAELDRQETIPIFHRWIRESRLAGELLIDVADYRHVPDGPGVMLIGDEGHYSLDDLGGRPGLSYARKRDPVGDVRPRLAEAFTRVFAAADALMREPSLAGKLALSAGRLEVQVLSRLVAPNTAATHDELRPHLAEFLAPLYPGRDIDIQHLGEGKAPFGVSIVVAGTAAGEPEPGVAEVLARLRAA